MQQVAVRAEGNVPGRFYGIYRRVFAMLEGEHGVVIVMFTLKDSKWYCSGS